MNPTESNDNEKKLSKNSLLNRKGVFEWENVDIIPIQKQKIPFAQKTYELIVSGQYDGVFLELPTYLKKKYLSALSLLPNFTVLGIDENSRK